MTQKDEEALETIRSLFYYRNYEKGEKALLDFLDQKSFNETTLHMIDKFLSQPLITEEFLANAFIKIVSARSIASVIRLKAADMLAHNIDYQEKGLQAYLNLALDARISEESRRQAVYNLIEPLPKRIPYATLLIDLIRRIDNIFYNDFTGHNFDTWLSLVKILFNTQTYKEKISTILFDIATNPYGDTRLIKSAAHILFKSSDEKYKYKGREAYCAMASNNLIAPPHRLKGLKRAFAHPSHKFKAAYLLLGIAQDNKTEASYRIQAADILLNDNNETYRTLGLEAYQTIAMASPVADSQKFGIRDEDYLKIAKFLFTKTDYKTQGAEAYKLVANNPRAWSSYRLEAAQALYDDPVYKDMGVQVYLNLLKDPDIFHEKGKEIVDLILSEEEAWQHYNNMIFSFLNDEQIKSNIRIKLAEKLVASHDPWLEKNALILLQDETIYGSYRFSFTHKIFTNFRALKEIIGDTIIAQINKNKKLDTIYLERLMNILLNDEDYKEKATTLLYNVAHDSAFLIPDRIRSAHILAKHRASQNDGLTFLLSFAQGDFPPKDRLKAALLAAERGDKSNGLMLLVDFAKENNFPFAERFEAAKIVFQSVSEKNQIAEIILAMAYDRTLATAHRQAAALLLYEHADFKDDAYVLLLKLTGEANNQTKKEIADIIYKNDSHRETALNIYSSIAKESTNFTERLKITKILLKDKPEIIDDIIISLVNDKKTTIEQQKELAQLLLPTIYKDYGERLYQIIAQNPQATNGDRFQALQYLWDRPDYKNSASEILWSFARDIETYGDFAIESLDLLLYDLEYQEQIINSIIDLLGNTPLNESCKKYYLARLLNKARQADEQALFINKLISNLLIKTPSFASLLFKHVLHKEEAIKLYLALVEDPSLSASDRLLASKILFKEDRYKKEISEKLISFASNPSIDAEERFAIAHEFFIDQISSGAEALSALAQETSLSPKIRIKAAQALYEDVLYKCDGRELLFKLAIDESFLGPERLSLANTLFSEQASHYHCFKAYQIISSDKNLEGTIRSRAAQVLFEDKRYQEEGALLLFEIAQTSNLLENLRLNVASRLFNTPLYKYKGAELYGLFAHSADISANTRLEAAQILFKDERYKADGAELLFTIANDQTTKEAHKIAVFNLLINDLTYCYLGEKLVPLLNHELSSSLSHL